MGSSKKKLQLTGMDNLREILWSSLNILMRNIFLQLVRTWHTPQAPPHRELGHRGLTKRTKELGDVLRAKKTSCSFHWLEPISVAKLTIRGISYVQELHRKFLKLFILLMSQCPHINGHTGKTFRCISVRRIISVTTFLSFPPRLWPSDIQRHQQKFLASFVCGRTPCPPKQVPARRAHLGFLFAACITSYSSDLWI